jgi:WD40 repeat protein
LRGSRLDLFERWAAVSGMSLTAEERDYLQAGVALRGAELDAEADQREREAALERRSRFRLRALAAVMAVAAVIAGALSLFAFDQQQQTQREARTATARELAGAGATNLELDPELAILLALEAVSTTRDADGTVLPEAEEVLHRAVVASRIVASVPEAGGSVAWSPNGEVFAVTGAEPTIELEAAPGAEPTTVSLYDSTGVPLRSWEAHPAGVNGVRFSSDGRTLATAGDDGTICLWDADTGSLIRRLSGPSGFVWGLSFSPDGSLVAGLWLEPAESDEESPAEPQRQPDRSSALIWDAATGDLVQTIAGLEIGGDGSPAQRTSFDAEGRRLAVATMANVWAVVHDVRTGERVAELTPADPARDAWGWSEVAWSPNGDLLAAAQANIVRLYEGASLRYLYLIADHTAWITKLEWSADGTRLLTASGDGTARLWRVDAEAALPLLNLSGHRNGVVGAALAADGRGALTADAQGTVRIWDTGVTGDAEWLNLPSEDVWLSSVIYDPTGETILGSTPSGRTTIWDADTGVELLTLAAHGPVPGFSGVPGVAAMSVSPDGTLVATGGRDATVRVWSRASGDQLEELRVGDWVEDVQFSPDGRLLAVAEGEAVRIFDVASWDRVTSLTHDRFVLSAKFTPDGRRLVSGSWDGTVRVWEVATWEEVRRIEVGWQVNDVGLDPEGHVVGAGGDGGAGLWDLETGERLMALAGHAAEVWAVRFSPDGARLATAGVDGTIRLWDRTTGVTTLVLHAAGNAVNDLAFSPDGRRLVSIDASAVRVWSLSLDELIEVAGKSVTRSLTDAECRQFLHVEGCL